MDLAGKKVIVTGGVRGLGRSIVDQLISKGASVTVLDRDTSGLKTLSKEKAHVACFECDVSNYEQVAQTTTRYHECFGAADILINNAGILYSEPLISITAAGAKIHDPAMWNRVLANDLSSVFYVTACIVEKMITTRTRGVIVNISSVSAAGIPGASAYSAAKAGVNALTASWAKELSPLGIRVVAVAPGFTDTDSTKAAVTETALRETINRVPLRRLGQPDEIAEGVLFVLQNDYFNGKVLELDGGLVI